MAEDNKQPEQNIDDKNKRLWWEIPARGATLILLVFLLIPDHWYRAGYHYTLGRFFRHTVQSRLENMGEKVYKRLNLKELPDQLRIIALKEEKRLELWGIYPNRSRKLIKSYPIMAASGKSGPKLKEGDRQVPEGNYAIESLNPNSLFYVSLRINYPSAEDKAIAKKEGRDLATLGSDIMLHGGGGSVGCIAVANRSIEEIFYITAKVGAAKTRILIAPYDFRVKPLPESVGPAWILERYKKLQAEMNLMKNLER